VESHFSIAELADIWGEQLFPSGKEEECKGELTVEKAEGKKILGADEFSVVTAAISPLQLGLNSTNPRSSQFSVSTAASSTRS
jgi:hypothetical protein